MTKAEDRLKVLTEHTYGTWRAQKGWQPLFIKDAEGVYMYDENDKPYLDFSSQLMCSNLGINSFSLHREPRQTKPH